MKYVILLLGLILMANGCHRPAKTTTPHAPKTLKKKRQNDVPCRTVYQKTGKFVAVHIGMCKNPDNNHETATVGILVLYTNDGGKKAAEESAQILIDYFKGKPHLVQISMSNIEGKPLYIFIVSGVEQGSYTPKRRLKRLRRKGAPAASPFQPKYEQQLARP